MDCIVKTKHWRSGVLRLAAVLLMLLVVHGGAARAQAPADSQRDAYAAALLAMTVGAFDTAARLLRPLVEAYPDRIDFRRNLAVALIESGETTAARAELLRLQASDPSPQNRRQYADLLARLDALRNSGVALSFAITPSSNINGATSNQTIDTIFGPLTIDEQAVAGIGVDVAATGFRRFRQGDRQVALFATLGGTMYSDRRYDRSFGRLGASVTGPLAGGQFAIEPGVLRAGFRNPANDRTEWQLGLAYARGFGQRLGWQQRLQLSHGDYDDPASDAQAGGLRARLTTSLRYAVTPRLAVTGTLALGRSLPDLDHFRSTEQSGELGFEAAVGGGLHAGLGGIVAYESFDGPFPGLGARRADRTRGVSLTLRHDRLRFGGGIPRLRCSARTTRSNVPFYDNRSVTECGVQISRGF